MGRARSRHDHGALLHGSHFVHLHWYGLSSLTSNRSLSLMSSSALVALCFVLFHIFASIIAFDAYKTEDRLSIGIVVGGHLLLSASVRTHTPTSL